MESMLTTNQAARRLGVKPATVYAYVSRGHLTSTKVNRHSMFGVAEVEALAQRTGARGAVAAVTDRIRTRISLLENDRLHYRGRSVPELSSTKRFEDVAHWLWTEIDSTGMQFPEGQEIWMALPDSATLTDRVRVAIALASVGDPLRYDLDRAVTTAKSLIADVVESLPLVGRPQGTDIAERLWARLSPEPAQPDLLNAALILLADHDLAISTMAARVAASAHANPYAVVSAGMGAMEGQKHGAATTIAYRFLLQAQSDPMGTVAEHLRSGQPIPGFGHRVYQSRDPRADHLFALLRSHGDLVADKVIATQPQTFPNVDLALAQFALLFKMAPDAGEAIFAIARIVGWIAHAMEEYREPGLRFRTMGVYTGDRP
ncbi:citrate synthase [Lentzea waywayandensis]|uniref:citrate synthase (unknown stereospecificity) n=1 Tax=Lentzea waywayandensis TaxID=84724 RepID=A0A1I6FEF9_9PSEU|nr:citrate synthase [Lentzea waywayandensis]SFR28262.1 citrate synthase [Lentzea waywayandensis]